MDEAAWIDAFVMTMSRLHSTASPRILTETARSYCLTHRKSNPAKVAKWRVEQFGLPDENTRVCPGGRFS